MTAYTKKPMTVNHEIKSHLARLLATEDLVVEHKKVETACFNVHTRVLTLPMWERASNTVYDMLVGHEVGHALFTPDEDWLSEHKIPPQFVNVVEDARIEKLMKRRYAGLAKTFYAGYKELADDDFFQIGDDNLETYNLADRANLYFKVGNFITLDFNAKEKEIIDLIGATETFADVLIAAKELYKYCKDEKQQQEKIDEKNNKNKQEGSNSDDEESKQEQNGEESEENQSESKTEQQNMDRNQNSQNQENLSVTSNKNEEPEVSTVDRLNDAIKELVNSDGIDTVYVELPQVNLDTIIGKNSEIHKEIDAHFKEQQSRNSGSNIFEEIDKKFKQFKISSQKEVNYLVKEFESRKAADAYSRSSTARTGVLNTSKLHSYKYSEDIFKKVTVIADGKNHGLVFILDWSGSMANVMLDTIKQLFNLVWFCKKVAIPFEVYAFTNEWRRGSYDYGTGNYVSADRSNHYTKKEGLISVDESFSLMNLLTDKVSSRELEKQMVNVWRIAAYFKNTYYSPYCCPNRLSLSGTPLNESIISLHQILPKFQKENKLQKVQCVILTDGEANQLPYHVEVKRNWESESYIGTRTITANNTFLRDRKIGTTYKFKPYYHQFTDILLENLKDKFPSTNFIGIRVLESRDVHRFINLYHSSYEDNKQYNKIQDDWKKMKSFSITKSGYDVYFGLSSNALSQESEFNVQEDATKAQIKSAFVKSLKTKKMNKKILGEFISLVV